ncbi:MAG TPA: hypothetical protein VJX23_09510 [Candidatus Binataceae bacterium]|nr:hypothetical protein [Candidatus Binataceae bacterium]
MNPTEYARQIEAAFQGEVQGAAMFHDLSERLQDPEHRYKLRVLEQLEIETREVLRPLAERLIGTVNDGATARKTGIAQASALAAMPWAKFMHVFRREVAKFVAHFEELEKAGPADDSRVLAALTAHERALQSFSECECSGASANSLEPVVKLLRVVPTR